MSGASGAAGVVQSLIDALREDVQVRALVHSIGDETGRGPVPSITIAEHFALPWGSKDRPGAEIRVELICADRGTGERLAPIGAAVTAVVDAMPRATGGWQTGGWCILRERTSQLRNGERRLAMSMRVRGWPEA